MLKVTDERLIVCCSVYTALALTATTNQSEMSVAAYDIWKVQTKLWSIEVLALIAAPGISTDNGLLLTMTARC